MRDDCHSVVRRKGDLWVLLLDTKRTTLEVIVYILL